MERLHLLCLLLITTHSTANVQKTAVIVKDPFHKTEDIVAFAAHNFTDLVQQSQIFLDKSLLIKELLENTHKVISITRPPHWGKTINVDMISTFLQTSVDPRGNLISPNTTSNYRLFTCGEVTSKNGSIQKLSTPPLIAKHPHLINQYLGRYPVLNVDFANIRGKNFQEMADAVAGRINNTFYQHNYMIHVLEEKLKRDIPSWEREETTYRLSLFNNITSNSNISTHRYIKESLTFLSEVLSHHFGNLVFVVIDEYDAPLRATLNDSFRQDDLGRFQKFYSDFLITTLSEDNEYIHKAILTGVLPLTKEDRDYGLNNVQQYTFLNAELMDFYGFSSREIDTISDYLQLSPIARARMVPYLGNHSYQFAKDEVIYNPRSAAHFFANRPKIEWLDIKSLERYVNFFSISQRHQLIYPYMFILSDLGFSFPKNQSDMLFSWYELKLFYRAMEHSYNCPQVSEALKEFQVEQIANKMVLFLYLKGYLSLGGKIMDWTKENPAMRMRLTDERSCKRIINMITTYSQKLLKEIQKLISTTPDDIIFF